MGTLHNVGADALEMVAHRAGATLRAEKGVQARVALVTLGARKVALAVPTTYMNESGLAVRKLATRFGIAEPASIVAVSYTHLDVYKRQVGDRSGVVQSAERRPLEPDVGGSSPPPGARAQRHCLRLPRVASSER